MGALKSVHELWDPLELLKLLNGKPLSYEPVQPGRSGRTVTQLDVSGSLAGLHPGAQAWAYLYALDKRSSRDIARALSPLTQTTRDALCADRVRAVTRTIDQLAYGIARSALMQSLRGRGECPKCIGYGVTLGKPCTRCDGAGVVLVTEQERADLSGLGLSRQAYMGKWADYEAVAAGVVADWQEQIRERMVGLLR